MIIDVHAHIFPPLDQASGFASVAEHRMFLQLYIATHPQPARSLETHRTSRKAPLGDGRFLGPAAFDDARFKVGAYGRFEWQIDGHTYYRQFLPPSLQAMEAPAAFLVQEMAYAGIDVAVLQNARLYGRLNGYFGDALRQFPGKFIGLADVIESAAGEPAEVERLRQAVTVHGMRGVYYANRGLFAEGYARTLNSHDFDPFWSVVEELSLPVFWEILPVPDTSITSYLAQIDHLNNWAERHPSIRSVLTHGIDPDLLRSDLAEPLARLLQREQFLIEVLYPIGQGRVAEYPYEEAQQAVRTMVRLVGAHRLLWGSDMPNVQRHCTYEQSRTYLDRHCTFLSALELDAILGSNAQQLFALG